jgi:hypothetical protein
MTARASRTFGAIVFGLALAAATVHAWQPMNGLTYLTFSRAVALPGVTLAAGTYAFEIANPTSGADVVTVRDRSRRQVFYSGLTYEFDRVDATARDGAIVFGEAAAGQPVPIVAWFPSSGAHGRQFQYAR